MAVSTDPQLQLDEKAVNDADLESALERRQKAKAAVTEARGDYKALHRQTLELIAKHDLGDDTAIRVGRFRITRTATPARHVEFDAAAGSRLSIALADGDAPGSGRTPGRGKAKSAGDDDVDVRPQGSPNLALLRGEADRATKAN